MLRHNRLIVAALAALAACSRAVNFTVSSGGGNATSPLQYGVMFEDINYSGDGGIYAELIRNRAFQGSGLYPSTLTGWSSVGGTILSLENLTDPVSNSLPTSMNVALSNGTSGQVGFKNTGWWGIDVQVQPYNGSFWVKGAYNGTFTASLQSDISNVTFGSVQIQSSSISIGWTQHNYTLVPTSAAPNSNNSFVLTFDGNAVTRGSLDFQIVSLFPPTYKNRPNGMRIDLMEALAGLNPSFLRLPGGNNIEGSQAPYLWYWNQTIGPLTDRPGRPGTWGYENTDGLGLVEYMWWCQDLEMEPILAVWSGLYLDEAVIPESEIDTYVQYALDELEFLMGSTNTTYGALRAYLGYPEPFVINYVEVGNEDQLNNGTASYSAYRFPAFYNAIHAAYPGITVIASTVDVSPFPGNAYGDYHEYTRPDDWVSQFGYFDNFSRDHHVLIGEYATIEPNIAAGGGPNWTAPRPEFPFWIGSVGEAVFLIGAERNSDLILGASYAPTFQNFNAYQWTPDLISFTADPSQTVLSTSWHMISLLSGTRITETLPTVGGDFGPAYWVAGINNETGAHILKTVVYNSTAPYPVSVSFDGVAAGATANLTVLTAPNGYSNNDVGVDVVQSTTTTITASADGAFSFNLPDLSVSVLIVNSGSGSTTKRSVGRLAGPYPYEGSSGNSKRTIPKGYREVRY